DCCSSDNYHHAPAPTEGFDTILDPRKPFLLIVRTSNLNLDFSCQCSDVTGVLLPFNHDDGIDRERQELLAGELRSHQPVPPSHSCASDPLRLWAGRSDIECTAAGQGCLHVVRYL